MTAAERCESCDHRAAAVEVTLRERTFRVCPPCAEIAVPHAPRWAVELEAERAGLTRDELLVERFGPRPPRRRSARLQTVSEVAG